MRSLFVLVLLLMTALYAETQEEAYYRAMKFEEVGDIPAALQAFEEAVVLPGPYTEELQGIIHDYKAALGKSDEESLNAKDGDSSTSFWNLIHVAGELGFYGMHYKETGMDDAEKGGELFLNVSPYVDLELGDWSHTFAASVRGDYFLNNDEMTLLDTNDWNFILSLEYTLHGHSMLLDLGYDFNIEGKELSSDFYAWFEKDLYRFEKQRLGAVAWAYYQTSGPMSYALYGAWHRTVPEGINGTVYAGAKFEADSVFDYDSYEKSRETATTIEELVLRNTMGKWFGPVFRSRVSYKFKNKITVEAKMNLFYGFAVGGPDSDFESIRKFSGTGGLTVSWKYWKMNYYLGLERNYKHFELPDSYKERYRETTVLTQLKLGVKWDI